jgi:transaldolase
VFCGRIADTGRNPPFARGVVYREEYLWASVREPYNIWQANLAGYDIITVPEPILTKALQMQDKDLMELSKETVQMFAKDGAGYTL